MLPVVPTYVFTVLSRHVSATHQVQLYGTILSSFDLDCVPCSVTTIGSASFYVPNIYPSVEISCRVTGPYHATTARTSRNVLWINHAARPFQSRLAPALKSTHFPFSNRKRLFSRLTSRLCPASPTRTHKKPPNAYCISPGSSASPLDNHATTTTLSHSHL